MEVEKVAISPLDHKPRHTAAVAPAAMPVPRTDLAAVRQKRDKFVARADAEFAMYVQSLLVWNIPSHMAVLLLGIYVLLSVGEWVLSKSNFFQVAGAALMAAGIVSFLFESWASRSRARRQKAEAADVNAGLGEKVTKEEEEAKKEEKAEAGQETYKGVPLVEVGQQGDVEKKEEKEQRAYGFFYPEDVRGVSSETYPLGMVTFFGKVKLMRMEKLMELVAELRLALRRAHYALRILRYSNPSQFLMNSFFISFLGLVVGAYMSGRVMLLLALYSLVLAPGIWRRGIWTKIRRRLEAKGFRKALNFLLTSEYLNLNETNTARVVAFVNSSETDAMPSKVQVTTRAIDTGEVGGVVPTQFS